MKKKYNNITEIWTDLKKGKTIYWANESYKLYTSMAIKNNKYQETHFSNKAGKVISARCISNYFGSLITNEDIFRCFSYEVGKNDK